MQSTETKGGIHSDARGKLVFFNDFSMERIKRFYEINPGNTTIIRAWQGHLNETKWFYCSKGAFTMYLIAIDKKGQLRPDIKVEHHLLDSTTPTILEVPGGFASGFKSTIEDSKLTVYSDVSVSTSIEDDYRFDINQYNADWHKN
jgi:dTDP-4-dehydrorhamnose 3,5-epimerase